MEKWVCVAIETRRAILLVCFPLHPLCNVLVSICPVAQSVHSVPGRARTSSNPNSNTSPSFDYDLLPSALSLESLLASPDMGRVEPEYTFDRSSPASSAGLLDQENDSPPRAPSPNPPLTPSSAGSNYDISDDERPSGSQRSLLNFMDPHVLVTSYLFCLVLTPLQPQT